MKKEQIIVVITEKGPLTKMTEYIATYLKEELVRNHKQFRDEKMISDMVNNAIDAFCNGASNEGSLYQIDIKKLDEKN